MLHESELGTPKKVFTCKDFDASELKLECIAVRENQSVVTKRTLKGRNTSRNK